MRPWPIFEGPGPRDVNARVPSRVEDARTRRCGRLTIYHSRSRGFVKGDVAVVNEAGDGIGRSAVLMLARPGLTVAAWDTVPLGADLPRTRAGSWADPGLSRPSATATGHQRRPPTKNNCSRRSIRRAFPTGLSIRGRLSEGHRARFGEVCSDKDLESACAGPSDQTSY